MKAITVQFDQVGSRYERLLATFIESWKKNAHRNIPLEILRVDPPEDGPQKLGYRWNHKKLVDWVNEVHESNDDVILIDCDMLCLGDISDGFKKVEHIGLTERPGPYSINGGVVFVKNTPQAKKFLEKWVEIDEQMLFDEDFHEKWNSEGGGLNQAALQWMLNNGYKKHVKLLPCETYNLCQPWEHWWSARMIHVKENLRRRVIDGNHDYGPHIEQIHKVWEAYNPYKLIPTEK